MYIYIYITPFLNYQYMFHIYITEVAIFLHVKVYKSMFIYVFRDKSSKVRLIIRRTTQ